MRTFRYYSALLLCCAVIALAATPVFAKDKWINLTTKNFNIVSNADEGDTRKLALKLEQFRYVFSKIFNLRNLPPIPATVMVFKSDDSFKPFKPLYNGKPANLAGYFQPGEDENLIALNINGNEQRPMALIFHEYTHLLTSFTPREWPLWLKEGLAELYSSFDVDKNKVTLGAPIASHVYLLRERKFMPLQSLFSVAHGSPAYNERDKQGIFYAQSWALAHYLMFGDKGARRDQLVEFVKLVNSGKAVEQAFTQAFKTDFAAIEKGLRAYIGNDSYPVAVYDLDSAEGEKEVSIRPLAEAEAQSHLGNLLMRTDRLDEAEGYFKQAVALDPNLARPHEGLGFLAMRRDNFSAAVMHFKEAATRDSKNHLVHYYYAEALQRETSGNLTPETAGKIREELKTAIKLMPGFAQAYYMLGFTSLVAGGELKEGAEMLRTAMRLAPQKKHYALTLAHVQARMQDYAAAKETLKPLLAADADAGLKASAQSILNMIEHYSRPAPSGEPTSASDERPDAEAASEEAKPQGGQGGRQLQVIGRPTLRFAGTQVMRGELVAIECAKGNMVLAVKTPEKLLRFAVTDKEGLEFYSQDPAFEGMINCGPVSRPAFIYFKPVAGDQTKFAGDAVAVEFTK